MTHEHLNGQAIVIGVGAIACLVFGFLAHPWIGLALAVCVGLVAAGMLRYAAKQVTPPTEATQAALNRLSVFYGHPLLWTDLSLPDRLQMLYDQDADIDVADDVAGDWVMVAARYRVRL